MAPIAFDNNIDEAPSSPRTAALYYWGGGGSSNWNDDNDDAADCNVNNHGQSQQKSDVSTLREYTTSGGRHHHQRHHRRPVIKFHLEMDDDCNHWMFLRRPAPAQVSSSAAADTNSVQANSLEEDSNNSELLQSQNLVKKVSVTSDETTQVDINSDGDFNTIPIINLDQPLEKYAKQIGDACRDIGFFYIVNHGIEECIMSDVMDASKRLFDLDLESKIALNAGDDDGKEKKGYRGYFGIGAEDLDNKDGTRDLASEEQHGLKKMLKSKGDFKEGYDVGLEKQDINVEGGDNNACHAFFGRNVWPDEDKHESVIGFRQSLLRYQNELLKLADKLMVAFATSLNCDDGAAGLPMDYFLTRTRNPMCTLRLLHYPPSLDMANSGCGAHTDYGLFTILQQDSIGGLEVRNHAKKWIDAKPLRGSFVINVGDMLSHWTNGVYASTVHRVVSPSSSSGYHRYSVPFFFNPDHDAVVEPILNAESGGDDCGGVGRCSSNRRRSSALEILQARYNGTFQSDN
eukprot:scaffold13221_cov123-Skeletonema_dohrnii-CCMP3373.AAC.10